MKRTTIFWLPICLIIWVFMTYQGYVFVKLGYENNKKDLYWTQVISKGEQAHQSKHTVYYDKVLVLKAEVNNKIIQLEVTDDTWFTSNVGDKIPFTLSHYKIYGRQNMNNIFYDICGVIGVLCNVCILLCLIIVGLVEFTKYLNKLDEQNEH